MKIKIERETKWKSGGVKTSYYVWIDLSVTAMFNTETEAIAAVESIKNSQYKLGSEIIFEEEI
jgi:hypothetical protein